MAAKVIIIQNICNKFQQHSCFVIGDVRKSRGPLCAMSVCSSHLEGKEKTTTTYPCQRVGYKWSFCNDRNLNGWFLRSFSLNFSALRSFFCEASHEFTAWA